ncbi:amino acid transporter [Niveomyces insectorum RCEF 264]|uniref:Amino acid transporter n=1 Tax=Niveomyces insectorum RCEF 264 TaxID=1081102 RepID=A0A167T934_9HYPO|nr:amino acid transporter [Niveomyces insectorum RCEF 264]
MPLEGVEQKYHLYSEDATDALNLTPEHKAQYINATLCLINAPSKINVSVAETRWDDLQYTHAYQMPFIHGVGQFLPWHRYFVKVHERLLIDECGYNGPMPYWNESSDSANISEATVWDAATGFGGNGTGTDNCVSDGPFSNMTLRINNDLSSSPYCLARNFNPCLFRNAAQANDQACLAKKTFEEARICFEGLPHASGHGGIGGTMLNVELSPGDPIFWLHHTYLDKLWWEWQSLNLSARLTDMSGINAPIPSLSFFSALGALDGPPANATGYANQTSEASCFVEFPFPASNSSIQPMLIPTTNPSLTDYFNDNGDQTTLNHTLFSFGLAPNVTIADIMDMREGFACSEFV